MQERGYNGFSFQDVAKQVGVSHVAVHHHFASKSALAVAAMLAYTISFRARLEAIDARQPTPAQALTGYVELSRPRCTTTNASACEGAMMSATFGDAGRLREAGAWLTASIAAK